MTTTPTGVAIDARSLLTKEELADVQGGAFTGVQGGGDAAGEFRVSQCVFTAEEPNRSVSLVLMTTKPIVGKSRTIKQLWQETFKRYAAGEKDKDVRSVEKTDSAEKRYHDAKQSPDRDEDEEEKEKPAPTRIAGLGDGAFWTSTHVGGTLYVLKGETLIRLSVGGPGTDSERMEKARRLAEKALARM